MKMEDLLQMRGITKVYGNGILANDHVDFSLRRGEIHAIAGENGAGKSTVMKILFGVETPTEGEIFWCGQKVSISSPKAATALGIGMVFQHFMLVNELSVYQNVFLGIEKANRFGVLDRRGMIGRTRALSEKYDMQVDPLALCGSLSVGVAQKVEILKVIARGAELIILDEPTAVLTPQETQRLFEQLVRMRADGHTVVMITHKLREIKELCDRVTILRGGRNVAVCNVADVTEQEISELMVGGSVNLRVEKNPATPGKAAAEVTGLTVPGPGGKPAVNGVSFCARRGEILCLAGVEGNGQQQVVECLTGIRSDYGGSIRVVDRDIKGLSVWAIRGLGLTHIPEDRMTVGTDQKASIYENLISVSYGQNSRFGFMARKRLRSRAQEQIKSYLVKGSLDQPVSMLSGGNMQKVVAARELSSNPTVVVADQPTRGVDVGAIEFIHKQLMALRDAGCCILLVSSDLAEVFALSDRILVFHNGDITAQIRDVSGVTEQQLGRYMLGVERMEVLGDV